MIVPVQIVSSPQGLYNLAGPTIPEGETKRRTSQRRKSHLDLLKIVMDGMTEACMKGGMETCLVSVSCVCSLLGALELLSQGKGLNEVRTRHLLKHMEELKGGTGSNRSSLEITEADFRWQRRLLSAEQSHWDSPHPSQERSPDVSISVTTDTGRTTLEEGGLGHTTPEEDPDPHRSRSEYPAPPPDPGEDRVLGKMAVSGAEEGLEPAPPRGGAHPFQDLTNFLSVDRKLPPSRYSESNFSVDEQETSRTEFDSCDQYSMAAEKDSGRSDVSDMGSDNCSLAEEESGHCHRSLHAAALSLRVLRSQEADQHSARIFVQSLITLLPQLLSLQNPEEVDSSLQSFASTFCSGLQSGNCHCAPSRD
uniref:SEC7 domain-containing protein n=1 Tax=Callorhinchus milii TaxID=7868 RepID=A0A4W3GNP3_CALMI